MTSWCTSAMTSQIRGATERDAGSLARLWIDWGSEYVAIDPVLFRAPREEGLGEWFERQIREGTELAP